MQTTVRDAGTAYSSTRCVDRPPIVSGKSGERLDLRAQQEQHAVQRPKPEQRSGKRDQRRLCNKQHEDLPRVQAHRAQNGDLAPSLIQRGVQRRHHGQQAHDQHRGRHQRERCVGVV